jgi:lipopolysaccharide/colanic/teichoic acid biosynthesis glycosyltransferase
MSEPLVEAKRGWQIVLKYGMDRALGAVGLVLAAPALAAIALAVRLDDGGPALFVQARPGLGGRLFDCVKFRTMIVDADRWIDGEGRPTRDRLTRMGRLLRFTSLDELPQLINIARGDMSFVGPRPPLPVHLRRYDGVQMGRFRMKPGITGLAQVSGRNRLKWSRRIELDNQYIDQHSLLLDLSILLRTVKVVLLREGVVGDRNPQQVDDLPPPRKDPA